MTILTIQLTHLLDDSSYFNQTICNDGNETIRSTDEMIDNNEVKTAWDKLIVFCSLVSFTTLYFSSPSCVVSNRYSDSRWVIKRKYHRQFKQPIVKTLHYSNTWTCILCSSNLYYPQASTLKVINYGWVAMGCVTRLSVKFTLTLSVGNVLISRTTNLES